MYLARFAEAGERSDLTCRDNAVRFARRVRFAFRASADWGAIGGRAPRQSTRLTSHVYVYVYVCHASRQATRPVVPC